MTSTFLTQSLFLFLVILVPKKYPCTEFNISRESERNFTISIRHKKQKVPLTIYVSLLNATINSILRVKETVNINTKIAKMI